MSKQLSVHQDSAIFCSIALSFSTQQSPLKVQHLRSLMFLSNLRLRVLSSAGKSGIEILKKLKRKTSLCVNYKLLLIKYINIFRENFLYCLAYRIPICLTLHSSHNLPNHSSNISSFAFRQLGNHFLHNFP